ncbi:hypothetical protein P4H66_23805 [Paenibacillus dokdonensis]|uniref:DNA-binding protein n=1 Tax=Paenibacillus dokdonensis TaxID=2567944 RepID=A0ABU6GSV3_9BACL|nr:hypothetical protein [Paenibacillus dokdonensis]MEC0242840.1 hypothetical protein [Paenibacillus dokdonensis]
METELTQIKNSVDFLVATLRMAHSLENWDNLIVLADKLLDKVYSPFKENAEVPIPFMEKPLVYYIGYGNLMKGVAYQKKKHYREAKMCIENYKHLHLFSDGSESNKKIVDDFKFFAIANLYTVDILSGKTNILEEYAAFIQKYPSETLPGLITILECANTNNIDVDTIIESLSDYVTSIRYEELSSTDCTYYLSILHLLSIYYYKRSHFEHALNSTIQALIFSDKIGDDKQFKKSTALFEICRPRALPEHLEKYYNVLQDYLLGVMKNEECISLDTVVTRNR